MERWSRVIRWTRKIFLEARSYYFPYLSSSVSESYFINARNSRSGQGQWLKYFKRHLVNFKPMIQFAVPVMSRINGKTYDEYF